MIIAAFDVHYLKDGCASAAAVTFSEYGEIEQVNLITDRHTGQSRGFAFITFAKQASAENALQLNGTEVKGRKISVSMAKERDNKRTKRGFRR